MRKKETTYERQYNWQVQLQKEIGDFKMGLTSGSTYIQDPRRLVFLLSRYKFVSKMIRDKKKVLEIGCGDGFGSRLVAQSNTSVSGIDIDPIFVDDANSRIIGGDNINFKIHNILESPVDEIFDAAYSLDVLEHISKTQENIYFKNICSSLKTDGVFIVGMPSLESQPYASSGGEGHINCKNGDDLRRVCLEYFSHVFLFSMNDEVVHTGFSPMAHYVLCLCTNVKPLK